VLQLQKVHRQVLAELARRAPLLPGADVLAFVDIDSQQKRVYGHAKQGAAFGHTKIQGKGLLVRGLNVLAATVCTLLAAPVIAATRLRGGNAASTRGAASMITEGAATARAAPHGLLATAAATSPSTYPKAGIASRNGAACSTPQPARQPPRPDQPRPVTHPNGPRRTPTGIPSGTQDKPQDSKRPEDDARQQSNINSLGQRARKRSPEFTRWIEAKLGLS
jgi:hypothetical protein